MFGLSSILFFGVLALSALCGLYVGGYVNALACLYCAHGTLVSWRPACEHCGLAQNPLEISSVARKLWFRGKCSSCHSEVTRRCCAIELICALAFCLIVARYGLTLQAFELLVFVAILTFLAVVDLEKRIIPNGCIVIALAIRMLYLMCAWVLGLASFYQLAYYLISLLVVAVFLVISVAAAQKFFGNEAMGGGDIKLFSVAAFYFGWENTLAVIALSCVIALVGATVRMRKASSDASAGEASAKLMKQTMPFGPAIAISCLVIALLISS